MIPGGNPLLLSEDGYQIQRSLRFRAAASAYATFTPGGGSGNTKAAFSFWVKRGQLGSVQNLLNVGSTSADYHALYFDANDQLVLLHAIATVATYGFTLSRKFRDPSAHYHIVVSIDTTEATSSDRLKVWVNGVQETAGSFTYYALNTNIFFFNAGLHSIGRYPTTGNYADTYLSEVIGVHGQSGVSPSSFGQVDPSTGQWTAKKYTGVYGTNGFYLDFKDPTSLTTLTADKSGNGNNWTASNISLTAGVTYDSMLDVPAGNGGGDSGNYCVLSPLDQNPGVNQFLKQGNLLLETSNVGYSGTRGSFPTPASGKWYWEVAQNVATGGMIVGVSSVNEPLPVVPGETTQSFGYVSDGAKRTNGANTGYGAAYTTNDVIGVALDLDAGTLVFYKNNVSQGTAFSSLGGPFLPMLSDFSNADSSSAYINFGQRPFTYTPPTGFKALHTGNLPQPTVMRGDSHLAALTWTGNGAARSIGGARFGPDLAIIKRLNNTIGAHVTTDSVRGVNSQLFLNLANVQETRSDRVTAFNADGINLGTYTDVNNNGDAYLGLLLRGGGAASANAAGSISAQVSTNPAGGISVVRYTGNGVAGATVGHGLGVAPSFIAVKRVTASGDGWLCYDVQIGATKYTQLNTTGAAQTDSAAWNNTAPTGAVFSLGTLSNVNANGGEYVAYCFSDVPGFFKLGKYTGNASADGPFVHCGFLPEVIVVKRTDSTSDWILLTAARSPDNPANEYLVVNSDATEAVAIIADILSNGFKLRLTTSPNVSGGTYIFAAFAKSPFKYANAR